MSMFDSSSKRTKKAHGDESQPQFGTSGASAETANRPRSPAGAANIGVSIELKGELNGDQDLVIDGTFEGRIELNNNHLAIGESGRLRANIHAHTIDVAGELIGDMHGAEKVVIRKSGRVQGNIIAPRVTLEDGAKFKGSIDMNPGESMEGRTGATARHEGPADSAKPGIAEVPPGQSAAMAAGERKSA